MLGPGRPRIGASRRGAYRAPKCGAYRALKAAIGLLALGACAQQGPARAADIPVPALVSVPAGPFVVGSDRAEREAAYRLDEAAYGHSRTRKSKWYENEPARHSVTLPAFQIARTPITNTQYAAFVAATGYAAPNVDAKTWRGYRLIHPFKRTRRFAWTKGVPPAGRGEHPVVLVAHADAVAYAKWLSAATGRTWRLPTEREWEKAARGTDGRRFPWGDAWDPTRLNSHDAGPFDAMPVGSFPDGASPFGLLDGAGQVYEWTANPAANGRRFVVKGGSWDDSGCGICRPAARHTRPAGLKHILIGFRLIAE